MVALSQLSGSPWLGGAEAEEGSGLILGFASGVRRQRGEGEGRESSALKCGMSELVCTCNVITSHLDKGLCYFMTFLHGFRNFLFRFLLYYYAFSAPDFGQNIMNCSGCC